MTESCKHLTLGDRVRITRDITEYREQFNFKAGMLGTIVGVLAQNPGTKEDAFDVHPDSYPKGWEIPLDTSVLVEREGAASQSGTAPDQVFSGSDSYSSQKPPLPAKWESGTAPKDGQLADANCGPTYDELREEIERLRKELADLRAQLTGKG